MECAVRLAACVLVELTFCQLADTALGKVDTDDPGDAGDGAQGGTFAGGAFAGRH